MLTWKIAWRNIWRHRGKSIVIGVILFLGALLMTVGNGLIEGAKQGLEKNMIDSFTGHLIVASENEDRDDVLFTDKTIEVLPDYQEVKSILQKQDFIDGFLPVTRGNALILTETDEPGYMFVIGVNFEEFQKIFPETIISLEGSLLQPGERGLLVPQSTRELTYDASGFWIIPEGGGVAEENLSEDALEQKDRLEIKDQLVLMGFSGDGLETDVLVPVKGIVKFKSLNKVWAGVSFIDLESYRECFGYVTAADSAVALTEEEETVLAMDDLENLFGETELVEENQTTEEAYDLEAIQEQTTRTTDQIDLDSGSYNLVLVKLLPGTSLQKGKERLQQALMEADAPAKVLDWKQASGEVAQLASITQGALFVFVLFIFFVAAIIIMNTLSMAAIERASELGMMRAIGARKGFVSRMFFAETAVLSAFFGGLGIAVGLLVIWVVAAMKIPTTGEIVGLLVGGDTVNPVANIGGVISGIVQLVIVTVLAMIYPIRVATKITPLEAISRD